MGFDWVIGCGFGWFVGPKFLLCDGLDWVVSVVWWVGLKKLDPRTTLAAAVVDDGDDNEDDDDDDDGVIALFTALHVMQTRYSEENSVCLSICPSVCPSHAWIVTKR